MLTSHNGIRSARRARQRSAAAWALRNPLARRWLTSTRTIVGPDNTTSDAAYSFVEHLRATLGHPDAEFALGVRDIAYAHSKPVVQLFDGAGRPVAYAKLGWSPTTAPLVRHEAAALQRISQAPDVPGISRPELVATGEWRGLPYLVIKPLPADITTLPEDAPPSSGARAVAGELRRLAVLDSAWWIQLVERHRALTGSELTEVGTLALQSLRERLVGREWDFGAWHGDWTWWNVGQSGGVLHVWDWEHCADSAPFGFDDLHWSISYDVQVRGLDLAHAITRARAVAPTFQGEASALLLAYLTELAVRSAEVSAARGGEPLELHSGLREALTAEAGRPAS